MSTNKNALIRYFFLDSLLSESGKSYSCAELTEECNDALMRRDLPLLYVGKMKGNLAFSSAKRLIQLDLKALEGEPFNLSITKDKKRSKAESGGTLVPCYSYSDTNQTLFSRNKKLSSDEKRFIKEVLRRLGKFSSIASFTMLDDLLTKLEEEGQVDYSPDDEEPIMSFEENKYLQNVEYLPVLFSHIANKQPVYIKYKKFSESATSTFNVHPYMLKQYSNRWYLICSLVADKDGKFNPDLILNLALDRMDGKIELDEQHEFIPCPVNLAERYEDIIGITFYIDNPVEEIIFAVSKGTAPYIKTKPIHETQYPVRDASFQKEGYEIFGIKCRLNYELLSVLSSFGDNIIVLSPEHIRQKMIEKVLNQMKNYGLQ